MIVTAIEATRDSIVLYLDGAEDGQALVRESVPVIAEKQGRTLSLAEVDVRSGTAVLPRFDGKHDRLFSEFALFSGNKHAEGVRYVTDIAADVPANRLPYPRPATLKALHATPDDVKALGIQQMTYNVNLPAIMAAYPGEGAIAYEHDGKTYWFLRDRVHAIDDYMREQDRQGVLVTMILLNSPKQFMPTGEKTLLDACLHPGYDWSSPMSFISAFDMRTEEGQGYYRAFCEFLAERYTREDRSHGRLGGLIISNEVDSQYVWGNAGEMTVQDYTREYAQAMRLAWLCARKHCAYLRVYASLDGIWHGIAFDVTQPLRYYCGRQILDNINEHALRDGNFPWDVAHHPYPEDLRWPDFWHDRTAEFHFDTQKISFRNMEVLPAYLAQDKLLYRGEQRRIIFSEQGFNSQSGPLQRLTEEMGEAGYVLAYLKARAIPTVDMLMHHAYTDNPHEFGLNLGVRRYDPDRPDHVGEAKPIYESVRDMDSAREAARIAKARNHIGADLFDYLLNPPPIVQTSDPDTMTDFGMTE